MAEFHFTQAQTGRPIEGGAAYIQSLCAALTETGHTVLTGEPGTASVRVVDGLALRSAPLSMLAGAVGLIHHTTPLARDAERDAARAAERERLPLLRRIIVTSDLVRDRLVAEFGVAPDSTIVIPPGVPDAPRSEGSGGPGCTILSIGALVPRKGHAVLLRALNRLFDLPWRLVIVGDPDRDPAHAAELRSLAGSGVQFAGTLDAASLEAAWRGADIFALATEWEGHGAAVAEALRRGLPVAVTSGGAAASLVTPECGVVCDVGDEVTLSKSLRRLIFDEGLRADMAEAAWRTGQTLPTWRTQAERFVEATCC